MKIGVLAVQGDFERHGNVLDKLNIEHWDVRTPGDLSRCDGLIIPGGESTTFVKLLKEIGLFEAIREFAGNRVIMGTCAGLITLAHEVENYPIETLDLIDISVVRNAYGRQVDSFIDSVHITLPGQEFEMEGVFIRAPKIVRLGQGVTPLGKHKNDVVLAENENIVVATFHPELTEDTRIHQYFIEKVKNRE